MQPHQLPLLLTLLVPLAMSTGSALNLELKKKYQSEPNAASFAAPPPPFKPNASEEFLTAHNEARAAVGVGPLRWSMKLAIDTSRVVRYQRNMKGCEFASLKGGKYGANQLWASGLVVTPRAAVETWVKEKMYYNHTDNSCAPQHRCGVYKQVVWKKSLEVGCAQATCKDQVTLTLCFYYPPGNVIGESPY